MHELTAVACAILLVTVAASAQAQTGRVLLPLILNQVPRGEVLAEVQESDLYVRVADLAAVGMEGPLWDRLLAVSRLAGAVSSIQGAESISLRSLSPWVKYDFDEANLSLSVTADPRMLGATALNLQSGGKPTNIEYLRNPSAFLNYSITSPSMKDVGAFGEAGLSLRGNLLYSSITRDIDGRVLRGLSNYTIDETARLRRWVVGDANVTTDTLGGSGIVGGVTVSRNFGLDPYFLRYPSFNVRGLALTPSRVDVYVNGFLVSQQQIPPGEFQLKNVPLTAGSGVARVVVRDAFGNAREEVSPYYYSTAVLAPGLSEYTYSAGFLRDQFGLKSFDYGDAAVLGYHRYGVTDSLTLGGRVEASRNVISGGPNLAVRTRGGDLNLSIAASEANGLHGEAGEFGYRYLGPGFSFGGALRGFTRDYVNLSLQRETDRPLRDTAVFFSALLPKATLSGQWSVTRMRDSGETKRALALATIPLTRRATLFVSGGAAQESGKWRGEYYAAVNFFVGGSTSVDVSVSRQADVTTSAVEVQRPVPVGTGFGYRIQARKDETGQSNGISDFTYQAPFGRYDVSFGSFRGESRPTVTASGGLVYAGGTVKLSRPIQESYALVRVPGVPNVRVYQSNQLIGRTDGNGDLFVPTMLSYYGNQLRIEDKDIPLNFDVRAVERTIAPPYRAGAVVEFPVFRVQTLVGSIAYEAGGVAKAPAFGQLTLSAGSKSYVSPIGRGGEFYFENAIPGKYRALVEFSDGRCEFDLVIPQTPAAIVKLGRLVCAPEGKNR